jgi:NAD+ synthase (glutamine-hydrolysing)
VEKNRFPGVVIGLSGGIDSALTAAVAVDALGSDRVVGVAMPSGHSSASSLADAEALAESLGIRLETLPIAGVTAAFEDALAELFAGREPDITEENLQARARGTLLMAVSNKLGLLVLATGNKSEMSVGYSTLYGDMVGGFAPLRDLSKTWVYRVARWRNATDGREVIPRSSIEKPPSAELRPGQLDTDSLPPYDVLDPILEGYVEQDLSPADLVRRGADEALVAEIVRMVDRAEYKRRQGPVGIKITPRAFGKDRRMPITNAYAPRTG